MPESAVHVASGKVREIFELDSERLLLVASDRISTFDVVLPTEIPDKGRVLTAMTAFWIEHLAGVAPFHLVTTDVAGLPDALTGRVMLCRRADMLPVECIVRGHLAGSAWAEYREAGTVHGHAATQFTGPCKPSYPYVTCVVPCIPPPP